MAKCIVGITSVPNHGGPKYIQSMFTLLSCFSFLYKLLTLHCALTAKTMISYDFVYMRSLIKICALILLLLVASVFETFIRVD